MTNEDSLRWLERIADVLHENAAYLTKLDSPIGDADHEKTMVDALTPAVDTAKQALAEGVTAKELTLRAAHAAEEGMKATIPLLATKGRASYLGERSIGHQDPGATSSWLILRGLAETL